MCTAVFCPFDRGYVGRTLDYEHSFGELVVGTPRGYFSLRGIRQKYALLGMACVKQEIPLYYDAVNEKGLAMVGLRFAGCAAYQQPQGSGKEVAQYAFIPYLLGRCADMAEVRECLAGLRITDAPFDSETPPSPLHWLVAGKDGALVIEPKATGLAIYENDLGVLTNAPPFPEQLARFAAFQEEIGHTIPNEDTHLPGDLSSSSRFLRAAIARECALSYAGGQGTWDVFHILHAVSVLKGNCPLPGGLQKYTRYQSVLSLTGGQYYLWRYESLAAECFCMDERRKNGQALCYFDTED